MYFVFFPGGSVVNNLPPNARNMGSVPRLERVPGEGHGNPLQYSCLGNPIDSGAWWATVHGITGDSNTTYLLNKNKKSIHTVDITQ